VDKQTRYWYLLPFPHQFSLAHLPGAVRQSRLLRFIFGMIVLMVIVTAIVDFQFKSISVETYQHRVALTSFLGKFYGRIGLIALLIQIFLSSRLIRVLGVGGAILFLPVSLMLGSIALFIVPGLWTAVALRGTDQSFRYSLNSYRL
jgi:ATP/ADP translocase